MIYILPLVCSVLFSLRAMYKTSQVQYSSPMRREPPLSSAPIYNSWFSLDTVHDPHAARHGTTPHLGTQNKKDFHPRRCTNHRAIPVTVNCSLEHGLREACVHARRCANASQSLKEPLSQAAVVRPRGRDDPLFGPGARERPVA